MKLKGKLTICMQNERVEIEITDAASDCRILELEIDKSVFVDALATRADRPCDLDFNEKCPVGRIRQHKVEQVFLPFACKEAKESILIASGHEKDGWIGSSRDLGNPNRRSKGEVCADGNWYDVGFTRFVDAETEKS